MSLLGTRTTGDTNATHVADHDKLHAFHNIAYNGDSLAMLGLAPTKLGQVLVCGSAGTFDAALVESPAVFFDPVSGRWAMVYVGYTQTSGNNGGISAAVEASIGLAWSDDLVKWTKQGQIFTKSSGPDASGVTAPFVWVEAGVYHLFYVGLTASGYEGGTPKLCHATSTDLATWTRDGSNPVIGISGAGTGWRSTKIFHPSIVKSGSTYYLFFNAYNGSVETIGYATATSISGPWTPDDTNSPVVTVGSGGSWDEVLAGDPSLYQTPEGLWVMHYYGASASVLTANDGIATCPASTFPLGWTKSGYNPTLLSTEGTFDSKYAHKPFAIPVGDRVFHYYTGDDGTHRSIGLAVHKGAPITRAAVRKTLGSSSYTVSSATPAVVDSGSDIVLTGIQPGDVVEVDISLVWSNEVVDRFADVASMVSGSAVNWWGSDSTTAGHGVASLFSPGGRFEGAGASISRAVKAADLVNDTLTLRLHAWTAGVSTFIESASDTKVAFGAHVVGAKVRR